MTRDHRITPSRHGAPSLRGCVAAVGTAVLTLTAAGVAHAVPVPTEDVPTVQVVLPVIDGGITVVVSPGAPTAPGAAPTPGAEPAPAPAPTTAVTPPAPVTPDEHSPARPYPGQTSPPAIAAPGTAESPVTTAVPVPPSPPSPGVPTRSSPPAPEAATTPRPSDPDRTWAPLPTAIPTYADGGTTPPVTPPHGKAGSAATSTPTPPVSAGSGAPVEAETSPTTTPRRDARAAGGFAVGVFAHSKDRVARFQETVGRPVEVLGVFPARGSWDSIMDLWWMDTAPEGFHGTLDVGVPLWQDDGDLATAAAGGYDARWEELGRTIERRYPGSSVRIGWEFNLGSWNHHASDENVEQWIQAFRRASVALKRGGPSLLVSWNPNKGRGDSLADATKAWPGDDVVDIVALDGYDWWPAYSESTWPEHRDGDQGWAHWVGFARDHGKKFAVPEWGVAPGNDHGGGDNPYYIGVVMDFLATEHAKDGIVHSVVYFDEPDGYIANSIADGQVPLAGEALAGRLAALGGGAQGATESMPSGSPGGHAAPAPTGAGTDDPGGVTPPGSSTPHGPPTPPGGPARPGAATQPGTSTQPQPSGGADRQTPGADRQDEGRAWESEGGHGPVPR